jgi:hypothetical protein
VYPAHHFEKGLLRKDGQPGFNTPSGKVEIASSLLAEYGYAPCLSTLSQWRVRGAARSS